MRTTIQDGSPIKFPRESSPITGTPGINDMCSSFSSRELGRSLLCWGRCCSTPSRSQVALGRLPPQPSRLPRTRLHVPIVSPQNTPLISMVLDHLHGTLRPLDRELRLHENDTSLGSTRLRRTATPRMTPPTTTTRPGEGMTASLLRTRRRGA